MSSKIPSGPTSICRMYEELVYKDILYIYYVNLMTKYNVCMKRRVSLK